MTKTMTLRLPLLAALLTLAACGGDDPAPASVNDSAGGSATPPPAAGTIVLGVQDVATAISTTIGAGLSISGNLDPADVVQVRAQVPGVIGSVRVDRGSSVRAGTVMAVIQAAGVQSQAAAAKANEAVARQRLDASKRLYEAGAISNIEYQTAQATYEAARAQSAAASESASRASITSPINGVVSARFVSGGEAVNPGAALFSVVNAAELELAGRVGVADAARVRVGQPVTFTLDAYPGQSYRGRVARIDPTADPGTRQVGVYVRLANAGNRIVGGQFARGTIETGSSLSAIVIPEAALLNRTGNAANVFVLAGNKASRRSVTLGERDPVTGRVAVTSGLQAGERVLLNPTSDVTDGATVSLTADTAAAPAARDSAR
jgi:membrane fusion protein (multidrug efflux system)